MSLLMENGVANTVCGDPGDPIDFAVLLDAKASGGTLARAPSGPSNPTYKFIVSAWVKRLYLNVYLAEAGINVSAGQSLRDYALQRGDDVTTNEVQTSYSGKDYAAYNHVFIKADANTGSITFKVGETEYPITSGAMNPGVPFLLFDPAYWQSIGDGVASNGARFNIGAAAQIAEYVVITGDACDDLTQDDFTYVNFHGVRVHKTFAGKGLGAAVYGANGFHLDFADPLDLGKDVSGNANHFTVNGVVTQITDTPTRNKINFDPNIAGDAGNFLNGNATVIGNNSVHSSLSHPIKEGVVHIEFEIGYGDNNYGGIRVSNDPNFNNTAQVVYYQTDGQKYVSGAWSAYGASWGTPTFPSHRMGVLIDAEGQTVEFFKEGVSQGVISIPFPGPYFVGGSKSGLNEGAVHVYTQRADMVHPIAGAKTLEWDSADCPIITDPSRYVQAPITIGGGAVTSLWNCVANKTLVLSKRRDANTSWRLNVVIDAVQYTVAIDIDGAQIFDADGLTFTTNGFILGSDTEYQGACEHFVRRASALAGMDFVIIDNHIVGQVSTVAHNCGGPIHRAWVVPLDGGNIFQWHHRMPSGDYTHVNEQFKGNNPNLFNSTANTASLGSAVASGRYLLILERSVDQFSSFDVYTGNGSVDGPMIPADFAPLYLDVVFGDAVGVHTFRTLRSDEANPVENELRFDAGNAENSIPDKFLMLSNGVKCADFDATYGFHTNADGGKYYTGMYALTPGKFANAR